MLKVLCADYWEMELCSKILCADYARLVFYYARHYAQHYARAAFIMRDIMRGDYARYYARLNLTVTTDVCSIGWLSRAMMCVDKGGVVGQA